MVIVTQIYIYKYPYRFRFFSFTTEKWSLITIQKDRKPTTCLWVFVILYEKTFNGLHNPFPSTNHKTRRKKEFYLFLLSLVLFFTRVITPYYFKHIRFYIPGEEKHTWAELFQNEGLSFKLLFGTLHPTIKETIGNSKLGKTCEFNLATPEFFPLNLG